MASLKPFSQIQDINEPTVSIIHKQESIWSNFHERKGVYRPSEVGFYYPTPLPLGETR